MDDLLFRDEHKGRILVNIGGISNLTVLEAGDASQKVMAMDTGLGNVLIDTFVSSDDLEVAEDHRCKCWLYQEEMTNHV